MIPEKWESIYLYAAMEQKISNIQTGEMFFYYFPKGVLKKNPVNVYEIPQKFLIEEESYFELTEELYSQIKLLRNQMQNEDGRLWSNITISIENLKFKVEFSYENLSKSKFSNNDRHLIWKYKYLKTPIESFNKKDKKMIEQYYSQNSDEDIETYEESTYEKNNHNIINFEKEEISVLHNDISSNNEDMIRKNQILNF